MFENYDDVVHVEDLMEMLDIGRNKAYELLQAGKVRSFKIGKSYRILRCVFNNMCFLK